MKWFTRIGRLSVVALLAVPVTTEAQSVDRLSDKDVKQVIDGVDAARDRFEDQLDGKVKNAVIRGTAGEINVKNTLEDFQKDLDKLKERYNGSYAASAEVEAVLRRANAIGVVMKAQPTGTKGASEFDRLSMELRRLAAAYHADFPLAEGATVRRIGDGEAAAAAGAVASQAEQLKRLVNDDKTMAKPDKEALKADVDQVVKQAKLVQSRLKESKPASGDARALAEKIAALTEGRHQLPPAILTSVGSLRAPLDKLTQAFGPLVKGTL